MKIVVFGAGGIIGQHMILSQPKGLEVTYTTRSGKPSEIYTAFDYDNFDQLSRFLEAEDPRVVVNLAGMNNVDEVQRHPGRAYTINVEFPVLLSKWCKKHDVRFIQGSTQAVYSGSRPPYTVHSDPDPINRYGEFKSYADDCILDHQGIISRFTFIYGVRPFQGIGRQNPLEDMLRKNKQLQVNDRWFSALWANDAADCLWGLADPSSEVEPGLYLYGDPKRVSRYDIACHLAWATHQNIEIKPVSHEFFEGLAPRAEDTTYSGSFYFTPLDQALFESYVEWNKVTHRKLDQRAMEISQYLNTPIGPVRDRLSRGFHYNHALVAEDFRNAETVTSDPESLLNWYRSTDAYIYELSAYHLDENFNYSGMCQGIVDRCKAEGRGRVLVMGDGIGDLSMDLAEAGVSTIYHDLKDSKTALYALFRFAISGLDVQSILTEDFTPPNPTLLLNLHGDMDAIVALDFFEHLINVEEWAQAVYEYLRPGGIFLAQNAFGIGDGHDGTDASIPMHLPQNARYITEWAPMMQGIGFKEEVGGWWSKPVS